MPHATEPANPIAIALVGDFDPSVAAHQAIPPALRLAADVVGCTVTPTWLHTAALARHGLAVLEGCAGIWCVPASPYADTDAALAAIRLARESRRPFLGTCGGFQHALIEYALNVLRLPEAEHAEVNPRADRPLIAPLACPLVERTGRLRLRAGSRLREIYGTDAAEETYHCSYGLDPRRAAAFDGAAGMRVCATDDADEVRAIELADHPFFIATLFQPERSGLRGVAHPLITAFVAAVAAANSAAGAA
jgi:CTP synthase (UTP-ammonia lyase)